MPLTVGRRARRAVISREEEHLAQADRHLAEREARIARQLDLIARLRAAGGSTAEAETLLGTMEQSLALERQHREMILDEIAAEGRRLP